MFLILKIFQHLFYKALGGFAKNSVNLTRLESFFVNKDFKQFSFLIDVESHPETQNFKRALAELKKFASRVKNFRVLLRPPLLGNEVIKYIILNLVSIMLFLYVGVGLDNSFANPVRTEKKQPQRFLLGHFQLLFEEILCQMKKIIWFLLESTDQKN